MRRVALVVSLTLARWAVIIHKCLRGLLEKAQFAGLIYLLCRMAPFLGSDLAHEPEG